MKWHKNISGTLLATMGVLGLFCLMLSSCLKDNNASDAAIPPAGLLSFVQASPDEPPLSFYLNSNLVTQNLFNYGDNIDYFSAFAGLRTANFYDQSMNKVFSASIIIYPNTAYTLFLANIASKAELLLVTDTLNKPTSGNAGVRFVNVSPDAPAVDLVIQGGAKVVPNKAYKGSSGFVPVAGKSNYTFEIRQAGTNTVLATMPGITLTTGYLYTIWFHGLATTTNSADKLTAGIITNASF